MKGKRKKVKRLLKTGRKHNMLNRYQRKGYIKQAKRR